MLRVRKKLPFHRVLESNQSCPACKKKNRENGVEIAGIVISARLSVRLRMYIYGAVSKGD